MCLQSFALSKLAAVGNHDRVVWPIIGRGNLLDDLEDSHALDHTAKGHKFMVPGRQGFHSDVELRGVRVWALVGHTYYTSLVVGVREGLVSEGATIDGETSCATVWRLDVCSKG